MSPVARLALLTDLDRTMTGPDLVLDERARARLRELRAAGVATAVVTGRHLEHLVEVGLTRDCDAVVAENGAVVHVPTRGLTEICDDTWAPRARAALGELAHGFAWRTVLASGHRDLAEQATARLSDAGVAHLAEFNAEEVMLLPPGIDKGHGARRALALLGVAAADAWATGDGENDLALFRVAGTSGAPAHAHARVKEAATHVAQEAYVEGFLAFTARLLAAAGRAPAGRRLVPTAPAVAHHAETPRRAAGKR